MAVIQTQASRRNTRQSGSLADRLVHSADMLAFNWTIRQALYRHIASQVGNGVAVEIALDRFRSRLKRRKKVTPDKIVGDVARRMRDGYTLSESLSAWVPYDETSIIASGELSGNLPRAMDLMIESKQRVDRIASAIRTALFTPAVYMVALYAVIWVIGRYVMPELTAVVPGKQLTGSMAVMAGIGDFANSWWAALPVILGVAGMYAVSFSLPRWTGKNRIHAERFFPYSLYRDIKGYAWLMSFTAMLRTGMTDVQILKRQQEYASPWLKERLRAIHGRMDNGDSLPDALMSKGGNGMPPFEFPNPDIIDDIASMAGFVDFQERIVNVVSQWSEQQESDMKAKAVKYGLYVEMIMYMLMGALFVGINSMSQSMANMPNI